MKPHTIKFILFIVTAIAIVTAVNCKKDPPVVPPEEKPPSHPTITWVADTIRNPYADSQLLLRSIWGSDTNDVYAIGHNGAGGNSSLYHFNGHQWTSIKLTRGEGGFIGSSAHFFLIDGSGKNDVWAVGSRGSYYFSNIDSSLVIHYDGTSWKEVEMERCKYGIQGLKVLGPNNVYLSGSFGEIYHYDGTSFTKTILDTNLTLVLGGDIQRMFTGGKSLYIYPNKYIGVYAKEGNGSWQIIKKTSEVDLFGLRQYGYSDFYSLNNNKYFVSGEGVFILTDTTWERSYDKDTYPYSLIRGTSATNVFAISPFARLLHWDGVDWKLLNVPEGLNENQSFGGLWVKDNKIFISCYYSFDTNIIYRGSYE